jgi:predicted nucleotidyltransferase
MMSATDDEMLILKWVVARAKKIAHAEKVILFGSRARGDAGDRSDFDIAIETKSGDRIPLLQLELEDNPLTLLAFDIVDLASVDTAFRDRILAEGKDITQI